jgi:glycerophosphoryl diester phosphodiesterase
VRRALRDGTPVIEIDTRLSADGTCVLMHDPTVDRTTDGTGAVASLTVAELKKLDAGSWFAPEFAGERVPTAAEVMAEARGKLILYFDLKVRGQANAIAAALAETGFEAADCWFWTYGDSSEAAALRARIPEAKIIGSDPPANWAGIPDFLASMRAQGIHGFDLGVGFVDRDPGFVRAARAAGFVVSVHTVLDPESMLRYALAGVDFIETDFPQVVRRIQP